MPRYLVERTFEGGLEVPSTPAGRQVVRDVVETNTNERVTWLHSFVTDDHRKSFCVYDGPSPEAIRRAAAACDLPVDVISDVRVLDPYVYTGSTS